jgi:hypothetical protein
MKACCSRSKSFVVSSTFAMSVVASPVTPVVTFAAMSVTAENSAGAWTAQRWDDEEEQGRVREAVGGRE